ncbi:uncharacterized protein [Leptinotarsa decemlineata]|uniref:uncharacterized protein n=1 Tax=Leptinotarsa decemlineata TaxID=7539 RepID=UPI003D30CA34
MARLHALWCETHPEHAAFSAQNLWDYVSHLRRQGYLAPSQPANEVVEVTVLPPVDTAGEEIRIIPPMETTIRTRRALHMIEPLKPQELARLDAEVHSVLTEKAYIWQINIAVYNVVQSLSESEGRNPGLAVRKNERRVHKMEAKIMSARQHASRIQCVMDYRAANRPFTPAVRRIAANLRRIHHTLSQGVLLTTKQHCLDRVRMLVAAKKSLVRRARSIAENLRIREKPSRLFQEPPRVVDNPPTTDQVESFWKDIYEHPQPLNLDTPALAHFEAFNRELRQPEPNELRNPITPDNVRRALVGSKNFAALGPDGLNTYWWKKLPSTHRHLARVFSTHGWMESSRFRIVLSRGGPFVSPKAEICRFLRITDR